MATKTEVIYKLAVTKLNETHAVMGEVIKEMELVGSNIPASPPLVRAHDSVIYALRQLEIATTTLQDSIKELNGKA